MCTPKHHQFQFMHISDISYPKYCIVDTVWSSCWNETLLRIRKCFRLKRNSLCHHKRNIGFHLENRKCSQEESQSIGNNWNRLHSFHLSTPNICTPKHHQFQFMHIWDSQNPKYYIVDTVWSNCWNGTLLRIRKCFHSKRNSLCHRKRNIDSHLENRKCIQEESQCIGNNWNHSHSFH